MSAIAASRVFGFYSTTIGKKAVMAVTGIVLFGFLIGHVLGNLQLFAGPEKLNAYAEFLHHSGGLLWGTRAVLLAAVYLHVRAAVQLYLLKAQARPVAYAKKRDRSATLMSRVMLWTGLGLLAFIVFHLLHFTTGTLHDDFREADVFHNMTSAFAQPAIAAIYVVAMVLLAMHLHHGLYSMTQSLGAGHPRYAARIKALSAVVAVVLAAGFASIPLAVLGGFVR
jgi:succinate dehydrogenase / fumarate reductase, cytochrome b subunit